MPRIVSFVVLLVILAIIAWLFFEVMAGFLLPLFLAVLLVVMFRPLHHWCVEKCKGRDRLAAALTTGAIVLIFLIPMLGVFFMAASEGMAVYRQLDVQKLDSAFLAQQIEKFNAQFGSSLTVEQVQGETIARAKQWLTPLILGTTQYAVSLVVGLCIMIFALYYFLVDGPSMVRAIMRLSPLDDRYEKQLIVEFDTISRAVVLASVVSAVSQGLLAAVGYYFAGLNAVFFLMVLTMLFAMVPIVGATAVWIPCCLWLYFHDGRIGAAIGLAVFGTVVVSLVDNVIKPMILHGRSNLHPLLALLSILGGAKVLGPIGIFVGPMVVTFLHAVLLMVQKEINALGAPEPASAAAAAPKK